MSEQTQRKLVSTAQNPQSDSAALSSKFAPKKQHVPILDIDPFPRGPLSPNQARRQNQMSIAPSQDARNLDNSRNLRPRDIGRGAKGLETSVAAQEPKSKKTKTNVIRVKHRRIIGNRSNSNNSGVGNRNQNQNQNHGNNKKEDPVKIAKPLVLPSKVPAQLIAPVNRNPEKFIKPKPILEELIKPKPHHEELIKPKPLLEELIEKESIVVEEVSLIVNSCSTPGPDIQVAGDVEKTEQLLTEDFAERSSSSSTLVEGDGLAVVDSMSASTLIVVQDVVESTVTELNVGASPEPLNISINSEPTHNVSTNATTIVTRKFHSIEADLFKNIAQSNPVPVVMRPVSAPCRSIAPPSRPKLSGVPVKPQENESVLVDNFKKAQELRKKLKAEFDAKKKYIMFLPDAFSDPNFTGTTITELYGRFKVLEVTMHYLKNGQRAGSGTMRVADDYTERVRNWAHDRSWRALRMMPLRNREMARHAENLVKMYFEFGHGSWTEEKIQHFQATIKEDYNASEIRLFYGHKGQSLRSGVASMTYSKADQLHKAIRLTETLEPRFRFRILEVVDVTTKT